MPVSRAPRSAFGRCHLLGGDSNSRRPGGSRRRGVRGGAQGGIAGIRVPEVSAPGGGCEGRVCGLQGALGAGCTRRVLQQESAGRDRGERGAPERAQ